MKTSQAPAPPAEVWPRALLGGVGVAIAFRCWTSLCFFPLVEWNSVRLAPTFMLRAGLTPYPGLEHGALTTWIYGPAPLLLNLPALLARNLGDALLVAGIVTLLCALIPAIVAVWADASAGPEATRTDRCWAVLLCLAVWPTTSLQYIQADNATVAFGLLSNVLLVKSRGKSGPPLLLAALGAALAVWSKQTAAGLILAQIIWIHFAHGRDAARRYALAAAGSVLALGAVFIAWFGGSELWLNLVRIPGQLPFGESVLATTRDFWIQLVGYVLAPAAAAIVARRAIWRRDSPWLLPMLAWLCLLPTALISLYRIGGAVNSLNGFLYLLPSAALAAVAWLRRFPPRRAHLLLAALIAAVVSEQLARAPLVPLQPLTEHLAEGAQLAREFPGRIYFPWHPLLTYFSEQRIDHAEDGLYTRQLAGYRRSSDDLKRDLPPHWTLTAVPGWRTKGTFASLQPASAQLRFIGKWAVYAWPPERDSAPPD